jgi:hypothetical protein
MSYFVLSTVFVVATTATLLHDIPLAPALRFASHNNSQVPTAARDIFSRFLNHQVTCPLVTASAPMASAAQRLTIAAPTPTSVSRLVEDAAATTSIPVCRTETAAGAIARQLANNAARRATTVLMAGGMCCTPANSIAAMDLGA